MSLVDLGKRLLEAAKTGNTDEVRNLMASGAPFTTDWLGTSPLHFGSRCGHIGTAEVLLRAGISRDARTKVDRTPLHAASQEGHNDIVELLLKHSADVDAKDMLKMTPLHWACEKGHAPVASLLMCHGADINCLDKFDRSPLDIAYAKCRGDIVQILQGPAVNEQIILDNDADNLVEVPLPDSQEEVSAPSTEVTLAMSSPTSSKTYTTVPSTDQSSTSVLATLAALAEATAPISQASTNTSAAEALNWLETHGITMVTNNETSSIVASQLESGQTFTLTEAGKLALNYVKGEQQETDKSQVKQSPTKSQKVITLVTDTGDHVEIVTDGQEGQGESDESPSKKLRLVGPQGTNITDWLQDKTNGDDAEHATLKHQLEEIQKQADEYKEQLKQKEEEADEYRRKLEAINTPTTT